MNKWRHISSPYEASVNDCIDSAFTSIHYSSIDNAVKIIQALDLKAAYHSVRFTPMIAPFLSARLSFNDFFGGGGHPTLDYVYQGPNLGSPQFG